MQKFDIKSQTFTEVAYNGYKANRAEMPPDLRQQVPYIRAPSPRTAFPCSRARASKPTT